MIKKFSKYFTTNIKNVVKFRYFSENIVRFLQTKMPNDYAKRYLEGYKGHLR